MDFFMKEGTSFDAPSLPLFITESRLLIKLALYLLPLFCDNLQRFNCVLFFSDFLDVIQYCQLVKKITVDFLFHLAAYLSPPFIENLCDMIIPQTGKEITRFIYMNRFLYFTRKHPAVKRINEGTGF